MVARQHRSSEVPRVSGWHASVIYGSYREIGGGFVFCHSALRRALLPWIYNKFQRKYAMRFRIVPYVWPTILSYQLFRDTTFSLLPKVVFDLLPVIALVYAIPFIVKPAPVAARR